MANVDAPLMQQVFNVSKRERKPDVEHHRQTDDLWARFKVAKRGSFGHEPTLASALPGFERHQNRRSREFAIEVIETVK